MDTLNTYRNIIRLALSRHLNIRYVNVDVKNEAVFDEKNDRYLVVSVGWQGIRRVYGTLIHIDIIDGKVWVQRDGTEYGIANELVEAGIPKSHIVLGFHEPDVRQYTDFAVA